jgi:DNA polymerase-3 subunit delta'
MSTSGTATATRAPAWGLLGHGHAVESLRHAIVSDRLAHAYLIGGPPGTGKATLARRLAQTLVCEQASESAATPCLECRACRLVEKGESPDVEEIGVGGVCDQGGSVHADHKADGSTRIRVCQVRRLERVASLAPFSSPRRIFIVDTADQLQLEGAQALLKTLEEPPGSALLILLATDVDALLPTIRSRCQQLALRPMPVADLEAALVEHADVDAERAAELAQRAQGRYGLAMQLLADPSAEVAREAVEHDVRRLARAGRNERFDYAGAVAGRWYRERAAVLDTVEMWRAWWRDLLFATSGAREPSSTAVADEAAACTPEQSLQALRAVDTARTHLLENTNPQLALEVMMLDLPRLAGTYEREEVREATAPSA